MREHDTEFDSLEDIVDRGFIKKAKGDVKYLLNTINPLAVLSYFCYSDLTLKHWNFYVLVSGRFARVFTNNCL